MKKLFASTQHYVILALGNANISFPTSKKDIIARAGNHSIRIDWDRYIPLSELMQDIKIEQYENKSQFFCALIGTMTKL